MSLLRLIFVLLAAWNIFGQTNLLPKMEQGTCGKLVTVGGNGNNTVSFFTFDLTTKKYTEVLIGSSPYSTFYFSHQTNLQYFFNPDNAVTVDASTGVVTNYANWKTPYYTTGDLTYIMIMCGVDNDGNIYGFFPTEVYSTKYNVYQGNPSQGWVAINTFLIPPGFSRGFWISGSVDNWGGNLLLSIYNDTNAQVISFDLQSREWATPVVLDNTNVKQFQPFLFSALSHSTVLMNTNLGLTVFSLSNGGKLHDSVAIRRPSLYSTDGWVVPNSNWTLLSGCGSYSSTNLTINLVVASDAGIFRIASAVFDIPNPTFWNICDITWSPVGCTQEEKWGEIETERRKGNVVTLN